MKVPLLDLETQHAPIRDELNRALRAVVASQQFIDGPAVRELEQRIAAYCSCAEAVAVSSGTDALLASLMALGIGPGDEVITTPYTFFATVGCIWRLGAKPVFVDIERDTFNIDASRIATAITRATKAVVPVDLFGQVAEMETIVEIGRRHGLPVIEDAAQSLGAGHRGRMAGSMGTVGCFSFYPSKNLGALGDGGMIVSQDGELAALLRRWRSHGATGSPGPWVGGNFRLDTLQAAALLVKLPYLAGWHQARRANAARYDELLAEIPGVVTPKVRPYNEAIFNQYVIRIARADACREHLQRSGIGCRTYYPLSLHQLECFASLGYQKGDFPESERAAAESLAIPIHPALREEQIRYVASELARFATGASPPSRRSLDP